ncbi:tyrosine-type recombinase/integrase [Halogeometricum sp. CBA1124]|uniref:tyrosine-type recombinase/integrase n=1 Tax=Halogeometricum sp. CBA1124 TaxID=2668071 RepID=UPI0014294AE0|nr:tyrosine-type recombinase/integrase [Halogeometricum sp. CBA1124]MUV56081.1 tyrosine-type recombinase/integrase [Halogeometricum sp. CBA1124]
MSTTKYDDVQRSLQNLRDEPIEQINIEAVETFIDATAAEGVGTSQQVRMIYAFKTLLKKFAPQDFQLPDASESELKTLIARVNRSDYAEASKHKFRCAVKKFYKIENGGTHPEKVEFFSVHKKGAEASPVTRDDLFTEDELKRLFRGFRSTRDRAFFKLMYESGGRPGEIIQVSIGDFTSNEKGDFIFLQGIKNTPDRTNQLIRAGRTVREWLLEHPLGGELGDIKDPSVPMFVKREQQACENCGELPHNHGNRCNYEKDLGDRISYAALRRRFDDACERAGIPENKCRPYNLRHTRLTEVAKFMGYEQLNKFAGWKPGSDRAKVYVHLNNDDVNQAIRERYGLDNSDEESKTVDCPFCGHTNQSQHSECGNCGRPLNLKQKNEQEKKQEVIDRLAELEEKGVLKNLEQL